MAIDRRALLAGLAAAGARPARAGAAPPLFAAARREADRSFAAAIFDAEGRDLRVAPLPARGHDLCWCPSRRLCVAFARRPGNFALCFSPDPAVAHLAFTTPEDRHFQGHGVFSRDGRLLYAAENDFDGARGVIGVYDVEARFARIGEFPSHGVGPHDLALLRGGTMLVVANGGFVEHPDFGGGRRILNRGAVETTLCYIDLAAGALVDRQEIGPPGALSLRHLDVAGAELVVIGAQFDAREGEAPLLWTSRPGGRLRPLDIGADAAGLARYVSSIAVDRAGEIAAITSSKGGVALMVDIAAGRVVETRRVRDVSGVAAAAPDGFVLTSGLGEIAGAHAARRDGIAARRDGIAWDNHLVALA